jgi:hypothetical protein
MIDFEPVKVVRIISDSWHVEWQNHKLPSESKRKSVCLAKHILRVMPMQTRFVLLESGGRQLDSTWLQWCWYLRHAIAGEVAQHEQSQDSGRLPLHRPGGLLHREAGPPQTMSLARRVSEHSAMAT